MPSLWMRKPRLVGLGDPDSRVWLGNEEMEDDNFHGFALLKSPGGITSNRESFSRPTLSGVEGLDSLAGSGLPVLPFCIPASPGLLS